MLDDVARQHQHNISIRWCGPPTHAFLVCGGSAGAGTAANQGHARRRRNSPSVLCARRGHTYGQTPLAGTTTWPGVPMRALNADVLSRSQHQSRPATTNAGVQRDTASIHAQGARGPKGPHPGPERHTSSRTRQWVAATLCQTGGPSLAGHRSCVGCVCGTRATGTRFDRHPGGRLCGPRPSGCSMVGRAAHHLWDCPVCACS